MQKNEFPIRLQNIFEPLSSQTDINFNYENKTDSPIPASNDVTPYDLCFTDQSQNMELDRSIPQNNSYSVSLSESISDDENAHADLTFSSKTCMWLILTSIKIQK